MHCIQMFLSTAPKRSGCPSLLRTVSQQELSETATNSNSDEVLERVKYHTLLDAVIFCLKAFILLPPLEGAGVCAPP